MILERVEKRRNLRALNLVRLQNRSIEVVGSQKTLEIIILVKATIIIGDPQLPQERENPGSPIQTVIMHQGRILPKILERSIITILHPMGQVDIHIIRACIQHQDLAITVMVAQEETMIGGREYYY